MSFTDPEVYLESTGGAWSGKFGLSAGQTCKIGRAPHNHLVLADNQVSSNHAMVQSTTAGEYYLSDLGSRNGTFVNRRRITAPVALTPGDVVSIGKQEFLFRGPSRAQVNPAPADAQDGTVVYFAQQTITTLVVDIRDFTGLSARLGETRISELISTFTRESGRVLADHGAWGQKFIGDAVMAVWVHPGDAPERDELSSVLAALDKLFRIAGGMQSQFALDRPLKIGAGVNTGLACVGNMGSDAGSDYTALSDAVNLAFRLESATKELGCDLALGGKTYEHLSAHANVLEFFRRRTVELKGYREPKPVYAAQADALPGLLEALQTQQPASQPNVDVAI